MPFTPVIPGSYQTDRQDLNDALEAIITAFITSTGWTIVRKFWSELPASLTGEGPFVALGDVQEEITHDQGTRTTIYRGSLWYVDWITEPEEYNTRCNVFADHMRDLFSANPLITGRGVLVQVGFQEGALSQGQIQMTAPQLLYVYNVQEGQD